MGNMTSRNFGTFRHSDEQSSSLLRSPVNGPNEPDAAESSHVSGYVELLKGSVPCPTCRGSGHVDAALGEQLVSFLPVNDKRLNPRTKLKVGVALAVCILVTSLTIAFLLPRSIDVEAANALVIPVKFVQDEKLIFMQLHYHFNVTNTNYYPVCITQAALDGLFDKEKISIGHNKSNIWIPMRSAYEHYVVLNVTFGSDKHGPPWYCKYYKYIPMEFDLSVSTEYLGHQEQMAIQTMQYVNCSQSADKKE